MSGTTLFTSLRNTMKRSDMSGTGTMVAPATSAYSGDLYVTNKTIPHDLGFVPQFRYYYEPFGDGIIYPDLADRGSGEAFNANNLSQSGPGIVGWADINNLYLQLFYKNNTLTGEYPVYWVIYTDFGL